MIHGRDFFDEPAKNDLITFEKFPQVNETITQLAT